jgi:hypothetical protein
MRGLAGMERRLEPEAAFGREIGGHLNVGDEEAVVEHLAGEVQAEHGADRRA